VGAYEAYGVDTICDIRGNVDSNPAVNAVDAALVLQKVADLVDELRCPGDVNRDGTVSAIDALWISWIVAGLFVP
jgi:hypothetical protein